jgi:hypothetical protein
MSTRPERLLRVLFDLDYALLEREEPGVRRLGEVPASWAGGWDAPQSGRLQTKPPSR